MKACDNPSICCSSAAFRLAVREREERREKREERREKREERREKREEKRKDEGRLDRYGDIWSGCC
jgi:hypothetical protein